MPYRWRLGQLLLIVSVVLASVFAAGAWSLFRHAASLGSGAEDLLRMLAVAYGALFCAVLGAGILAYLLLLRPILRITASLDRREVGRFTSQVEEIDRFYRAVEQVSASLAEIEEANRLARHAQTELRVLASTDELTGVANRRWFTNMAGRELDRSRRYGHVLALLMIDIDHFKRVNDTYGHGVGDEVLRVFSRALESNLRSVDVLGRLGGEEFAVVLPESARDAAILTAERLRSAVAGLEVPLADGTVLTITTSVGLALSEIEGESLDKLLARADRALYAAKEQGRNRVVVA